jgi:anti-sigma B factor antagonist
MKLDIRQENDVTVLAPTGSLVMGPAEDTMNQAVSRLLGDGRTRLVIDISGVKRMDSSGIETLLIACQQAREKGGDAKLARVSPRFQTLLEIAHLTKVLEIYPEVADAVSSYTRRP